MSLHVYVLTSCSGSLAVNRLMYKPYIMYMYKPYLYHLYIFFLLTYLDYGSINSVTMQPHMPRLR